MLMATPRVLVLRAPGANCDEETQFAFQKAGAIVERLHINRLREEPAILHRYQILVVPGGFTYGDDVAAGNIIAREPWILKGLDQAGQVVLRYVDSEGNSGPYPINPNGSQEDVAGLCDASGRVLGLMPHPERHVLPTQHPRWTREGLKPEGDGLRLFRNAVEFFQ